MLVAFLEVEQVQLYIPLCSQGHILGPEPPECDLIGLQERRYFQQILSHIEHLIGSEPDIILSSLLNQLLQVKSIIVAKGFDGGALDTHMEIYDIGKSYDALL